MEMRPSHPRRSCASRAERQLFEWLRNSNHTEGWICMHSVRLGWHRYKRSTEIDFLLLTPLGVLVLEVKGGRVDQQGRRWLYTDGAGRVTRSSEGPFEQAAGAMHSLETFLRDQEATRELPRQLLIGWGVMMPDMPRRSWGSEAVPGQIHDRSTRGESVRSVVERMLDVAHRASHAQHRRPPTLEECRLMADTLQGDRESLSGLEIQRRMIRDRLLERASTLHEPLDTLGADRRMVISAPAGTGARLIAMEAARRGLDRGERVRLVGPPGLLDTLPARGHEGGIRDPRGHSNCQARGRGDSADCGGCAQARGRPPRALLGEPARRVQRTESG